MGKGGAPKGNKNNTTLKTPELKRQAYEQYCKWIASGKSHKSWYFEHPQLSLCWESMESYIKNDPVNFDPLHKKIAMAKSLELWEGKGEGMIESQEKCQPAIYQMFMRNKFGWDKETPEEKVDREKRESRILETVYEDLEKRYKDKEKS